MSPSRRMSFFLSALLSVPIAGARWLYLHFPLRVGGWGGAEAADVCTAWTPGIPRSHWSVHEDACYAMVDNTVQSWVLVAGTGVACACVLRVCFFVVPVIWRISSRLLSRALFGDPPVW